MIPEHFNSHLDKEVNTQSKKKRKTKRPIIPGFEVRGCILDKHNSIKLHQVSLVKRKRNKKKTSTSIEMIRTINFDGMPICTTQMLHKAIIRKEEEEEIVLIMLTHLFCLLLMKFLTSDIGTS